MYVPLVCIIKPPSFAQFHVYDFPFQSCLGYYYHSRNKIYYFIPTFNKEAIITIYEKSNMLVNIFSNNSHPMFFVIFLFWTFHVFLLKKIIVYDMIFTLRNMIIIYLQDVKQKYFEYEYCMKAECSTDLCSILLWVEHSVSVNQLYFQSLLLRKR